MLEDCYQQPAMGKEHLVNVVAGMCDSQRMREKGQKAGDYVNGIDDARATGDPEYPPVGIKSCLDFDEDELRQHEKDVCEQDVVSGAADELGEKCSKEECASMAIGANLHGEELFPPGLTRFQSPPQDRSLPLPMRTHGKRHLRPPGSPLPAPWEVPTP